MVRVVRRQHRRKHGISDQTSSPNRWHVTRRKRQLRAAVSQCRLDPDRMPEGYDGADYSLDDFARTGPRMISA